MSRSPRHRSRRELFAKLGLALGAALLVLLVTQEEILRLGILRRMELATIDYRFRARGPAPWVRDSGNVVIVEISEESQKSLPEKFPWPRSYYARLIRNLKAAGARAVGIDLILGGRDAHGPGNDDELRRAIAETGIVVLAGKVEESREEYRHTTARIDFGNTFFEVDSALGLVNVVNDDDGVLRRYLPYMDTDAGFPVPTFAFAVLGRAFGLAPLTPPENFPGTFSFHFSEIPKFDRHTFLVNFYGPSRTFRHIKFADVIDDSTFTTLEEGETGEEVNTFSDPDFGYLHDGTFRDKIVLVGSTAPEDHDLFPIAFARGAREGDNLMYGVEIHANVVQSILREEFLRRQPRMLDVLAVLFFTFVTFFVTSALKGARTKHAYLVELNGFLFALAEILTIGFAALLLFSRSNYVMSVVSPIAAVLAGYVTSTAYHFVAERKQRLLIKTMFSTYVNPQFVDELIRDPEKLRLGGERKELTVLFADIEGFTSIAESLPSDALVGILNEYLNAMSEVVFRHNGTLDKYLGDAVMAFWGAPIAQPDHALLACSCAIDLQRTAASLRARAGEGGAPALHVRIGINTGEMVVGNMGGASKFDYTVVGDSVNLASRLEGTTRTYRTGTIVSARTHELVRHAIVGREVDLIAVKGRREPVRIFELLRRRDEPREEALEQFLARYEEGLQLYRARRWAEAKGAFLAAAALRPEDHPTRLHLDRVTLYEQHPPPPDWDGVFVMSEK
jgi:adenylate cyclase